MKDWPVRTLIAFLLIGLLCLVAWFGGWAVSYTHLDVYKRQTFIMPARNVEVSAVFTANAYSITVVQPANLSLIHI